MRRKPASLFRQQWLCVNILFFFFLELASLHLEAHQSQNSLITNQIHCLLHLAAG